MEEPQYGQCACGAARFAIRGAPILRGFCHCTICQAFNQSACADFMMFRGSDIVMPAGECVEFKTYRAPPAVQRGRCRVCDGPALEFIHLLPMLKLLIVPTANVRAMPLVPAPSLHIFYDTRAGDVEDDLPKFSGYWPSQLALGHRLISALRHAGEPG